MNQPLWKRRSVVLFFVVGFGVPWVGLTIRAITGLTGPWGWALHYTGDFMSVAGFVGTAAAAGLLGLKSLARRCLRIRVPIGWALVALFAPLTWYLIPAGFRAITRGGIGTVELGGVAEYLAPGVLLALTTGPLGEEVGWRGFLEPRMLKRYSPLMASVMIGVIWSLWHLPLYWERWFSSPVTLAIFTLNTVCYSVIMTALWAFTRGSVFWAIVFHWSVNISGGVAAKVFPDIHGRGYPNLPDVWENLAMVLVAVTVFMVARRKQLSGQIEKAMVALSDEAVEADRERTG